MLAVHAAFLPLSFWSRIHTAVPIHPGFIRSFTKTKYANELID